MKFFATWAASLAAAIAIPSTNVLVLPRGPMLDGPVSIKELIKRDQLVPIEERTDILEKRAFSNKTFNLSWQKEKATLFSAGWQGSSPRVPIAPLPVPITHSVAGAFSVTMQCTDCKTYGTIEASLDDSIMDGDGIEASLVFRNVGAYMDLSLFTSGEGTYTVGLGAFVGPPGNVTGKSISADMGLSMDLILQVNGEVQANGGFQISVPDGERMGIELDFNIGSENKVKSIIGVAPKVNFSLLPLAISDASINITAALRIKADATLSGSLRNLVSFSAGAGAHLTLARARLGAAVNGSGDAVCRNALSVDVGSDAGAYARLGASAGAGAWDAAPAVSTVFFSAGATVCRGDRPATPRFVATQPETRGACAAAAVTATATTTSVYRLTTCAVPELDCPARFAGVVVATNVETVASVRCSATAVAAAAAAAAVVVAPVAPTGSPISLSRLPTLQSATAASYPNVTVTASASVVTGTFVAVTPPPDPESQDKKKSDAVAGRDAPALWVTGSALLVFSLVMITL